MIFIKFDKILGSARKDNTEPPPKRVLTSINLIPFLFLIHWMQAGPINFNCCAIFFDQAIISSSYTVQPFMDTPDSTWILVRGTTAKGSPCKSHSTSTVYSVPWMYSCKIGCSIVV